MMKLLEHNDAHLREVMTACLTQITNPERLPYAN